MPRAWAAVTERGPTVLAIVVDDDLRALVKHMLDGLYTVLLAGNAAEALGVARSSQVDVLVTEAEHGRRIADRLRQHNPWLAVLYIVGHPDFTGLEGEVMLKQPFSGEELRHAIGALRHEDEL